MYRKISKEDLQEVLRLHKLWVEGHPDGVRANLRMANLRWAYLKEANLQGVDLWNCVGNMKEVKSLQIDTYRITYTKDFLQIGCQGHPIEDWWSFDDETIKGMDKGALEWWKSNKDYIKMTLERYPAVSTKSED